MSDRPGEMDERDVDERFASIVAGWDLSATDGSDPADDGPEPTDPTSPTDRTDPTAAPLDPSDDKPGDAEPDSPRRPAVNPSPLAGILPASSWRVVQPPPVRDADDDGSDGPAAAAPSVPGPEDDEHFEPPSVQLPPQEDLHFWGAVLGLVAGPLCLVYVAMARPFHSTRWFLAGLALSLLGFALLVLRSPQHRDEDDDGARV